MNNLFTRLYGMQVTASLASLQNLSRLGMGILHVEPELAEIQLFVFSVASKEDGHPGGRKYNPARYMLYRLRL